jgi:hypothetical protein
MAWYDVDYSCGHSGRVNLIGPGKQREWKLECEAEKLCFECYQAKLQAEREVANKAAAEQAKEMELPELAGTEKQVAWANTLRQTMIQKVAEMPAWYDFKKEDINFALDYVISQTNASWFIDNRFDIDIQKLIKAGKNMIVSEPTQETPVDVKQEATVYPENKITNAVVEIVVTDDCIKAQFEKNDKFREIVKSLNYKWDGVWLRKISELTGSAADRAAELGNKLLNAGFPIMIMDSEIRQNAIDGIYEPECDRWIRRNKATGNFSIRWWEDNDKLYRVARSLPGSKWSSIDKSVIIDTAHYKEVQEFANLYEFKFSQKALEAISNQIAKEENAIVVNPAKVETQECKDGLDDILNSSDEIIEDLKD